ncbi:hypothetical protein GCM10010478_11020 [Streptomyces erythrogriseus]|uniref:FXSXX-COOH protein n=3 Tax=Streptomyces TaxID=1883 RepID=A0ABP7YUQ2_9ACTN|nr:hypothetical protein GCM10010265_36720 [Streptomyces griseoincarnatus]GGQ54991.1 hypothetical protein GCM10010267_17440 [Streptomyces griseorubens]GGT46880.1 hypothetical protein GCM10010243_25710 [Streptomyces matensis]
MRATFTSSAPEAVLLPGLEQPAVKAVASRATAADRKRGLRMTERLLGATADDASGTIRHG